MSADETMPEAEDVAAATVPEAPVIRVLSGWPTDEDLAALVAVLSAASGGDAVPPPPAPSRWSAPGARLRTAYGPARGAWRASGLPR